MVIRVEDDGPGIKANELTLFLQGRGQSKKRNRFAIGLSTVNHIVTNHGGRVVYQKSKFGGACFELRLRDELRLTSKNQEVN
jgi:sensor histidine kinase regulating citrate/malate metabolism